MTRLLGGLALALAMFAPLVASAQRELTAPHLAVRVIDGDTIEIGGRIIDLYGLDAPELGQQCLHNDVLWTCGLDAAYALKKLLVQLGEDVKCTFWGANEEGDRKAVCEMGEKNLALVLIFDGLGVADRGAFPDYAETEHHAKTAGLGIWRGPFVPPWEWRAGKRLRAERRAGVRGCPIKSVIDDSGRRVTYFPTDENFDRVRVDPAKGGRCFSTDKEALKAAAAPSSR